MAVWRGDPRPEGATYDPARDGVNFSVFSGVADGVELCLFDDAGVETRVELPRGDAGRWHGFVPGVRPGQRYGYRVHGPWDPFRGHRCNPAKLLLDPYARHVHGGVRWDPAVLPHPPGDPDGRSDGDSAPFVPRGVVIDERFDWRDDRPPGTAWADTVIYEVHVKGFTFLHPEVPARLRGTYAGMASEPAVDHLRRLGVTAVELLPVHQFVHDGFLLERGLRNYWGYNTLGFFAPHNEYAAGDAPVDEFKAMVRALHAAGIEVILDVVYNHTAEGNHLGPMLSLKGFDNAAYYRLAGDRRHYYDTTGTGNSLNAANPHALRLVMDSLRYWVTEMHVDGFRFDLATVLGREADGGFDRLASFFDIVQQDPVLAGVKLIAEPWDVSQMDSYQVGEFPPGWSEWNGRYRDAARDLWRSVEGTFPGMAWRLLGSPDLYRDDLRSPWNSVNLVTAHDGFTLHDLVSYNHKHNAANGEDSGEDENRSWNCGEEGPTANADVLALRARQQRNFLATLFLSTGVPMLLGGDEISRTQQGNNNGYCQDSPISWFDWERAGGFADLFEYTAALIRLRRRHPVFRRRQWLRGVDVLGDVPELRWYAPDGARLLGPDAFPSWARAVTLFLDGGALTDEDGRGNRLVDDSFLLCLNAYWERLEFKVPEPGAWVKVLDTAVAALPSDECGPAGSPLALAPRSLVLLRRPR